MNPIFSSGIDSIFQSCEVSIQSMQFIELVLKAEDELDFLLSPFLPAFRDKSFLFEDQLRMYGRVRKSPSRLGTQLFPL